MEEYVSDAVVLVKRPSGELDTRYTFFTKKFGKMVGRAKSARKITSKLSGHLEPGSLIKVRFIEKTGTQVVDALKLAKLDIPFDVLAVFASLVPDMEPDMDLWEALHADSFSWPHILAVLGWDPAGALCMGCGKREPAYFFITRQEFFCAACVSKLGSDKVNLIEVKNS